MSGDRKGSCVASDMCFSSSLLCTVCAWIIELSLRSRCFIEGPLAVTMVVSELLAMRAPPVLMLIVIMLMWHPRAQCVQDHK